MCVIQCGLREACRHFLLPFEEPSLALFALESEQRKGLDRRRGAR
jgi:hypothetical protein